MEEDEEYQYCNRCGQEISIDEYDSNVYGFCEDCFAEREEEDYREWLYNYNKELDNNEQ